MCSRGTVGLQWRGMTAPVGEAVRNRVMYHGAKTRGTVSFLCSNLKKGEEESMPKKLQGLVITSTDLVDQGANPDAHISLFKRAKGKETEAPGLHPEVKKTLDENRALTAQIDEMRKSLALKDLTAMAQKYEVVGKKAEELAPKLYELKKAGGTAYEDYVGLLDEQVTLVEKSGMFGEIGSNRAGTIGSMDGELRGKAVEITKNMDGLNPALAMVKAFEQNPELAAQYEAAYQNRR